MLNMQTKVNRFNAPTQFNVSQNDAAEFNSAVSEVKNAVVDQGGILTPAQVPDYLTDDPHQLNKSIIAGGGWIMPTASVTTSLVTFTSAAAGAGNFPIIAQFTNKFLQFITAAVPSTGTYEVDYDGDVSPLLDLFGNPLVSGQLPAKVIAEIFYNGTEWRLKNTAIAFNSAHRLGDGSDHSDVAQNSTDIGNNTTAIGNNASDIADINADVNSYALVQGDMASSGGTFTLLAGYIKWHISGKKIWVFWKVAGTLSDASSFSISVDVVTNTSLPSNPWADLVAQATDVTPKAQVFRILALTNGFTILTEDGANIVQAVYDWRGSFFHQLP